MASRPVSMSRPMAVSSGCASCASSRMALTLLPGTMRPGILGMARCGFLMPPRANLFCTSLSVGLIREVVSVVAGVFQRGSVESSSFFQLAEAFLCMATAMILLSNAVYSPCALDALCLLPSTVSHLCTVDMWAAS